MDWDEFLARAKEVTETDKDLWKQLRALYTDRGTLQQLVRAILDMEEDLKEGLANTQMISDEKIRVAIGLQGQVLGIKNVLGLIAELMREPAKAEEDNNV